MTALTKAGSTTLWRKIRLVILTRDGYVCHWCHGYADTVDHVLSRAEGGQDTPENLVAACRRCNFRRGAILGNQRRNQKHGSFFLNANPAHTPPCSRYLCETPGQTLENSRVW
jgi:5-methylcytosine-specific restriction endonuclease McrA